MQYVLLVLALCSAGVSAEVCGSDYYTYSTVHRLKAIAEVKPGLTLLYEGPCNCKELIPNEECLEIKDPICGDDFQTYDSFCVMCTQDKERIQLIPSDCPPQWLKLSSKPVSPALKQRKC